MKPSALILVLTLFAAIGCSDDKAAAPAPMPSPTTATATRDQTDRQRPPANVAPVTAPSAAMLAGGQTVPFKVCSQRTGWQKPSPEAMAAIFTDRRFGDGEAPFPLEYTFYLTPFYFPIPFSASVNKVSTAFGGFWDNSGTLEHACDREAMRTQGNWMEFTAAGYNVVDVRMAGSNLVIVVERGSDGWQNIVYPYPPESIAASNARILSSRQVLDTSGRLLYQDLWPMTGAAWQQTLHYGDDGQLRAMVIGGILPYASADVAVIDGQPPLRLYSSSPAQAIASGSLRVLDASGAEVTRVNWDAGNAFWEPLGALTLEPGTFRLLFADQRSDWHHFVLLAEDVPLPPGVEP